MPLADWLRQEKYYALVKAKLTGPAAEHFFDTGALCALLDAHRAGKTNAMTKLWAFYCFIEWYEVYFTGKSRRICKKVFAKCLTTRLSVAIISYAVCPSRT